jgi:3-oxoadipate enol-lactonase
VLVCGGKYDEQVEPAVVGNLAKSIPGAGLKYFEGGHIFFQQDPKAYEAVIDFLKREGEPRCSWSGSNIST